MRIFCRLKFAYFPNQILVIINPFSYLNLLTLLNFSLGLFMRKHETHRNSITVVFNQVCGRCEF